MKYRLISDIHTEIFPENFNKVIQYVEQKVLPHHEEDENAILLLAGDIGSLRRKNMYAEVIKYLLTRFKAIIDIPGNHYWYGDSSFLDKSAPFEDPNYFFGETVKRGSVCAATLWTDFSKRDPLVEATCYQGMNDYHAVQDISTQAVYEAHTAQLEFLDKNIKEGGVVMTHHAPSFKSIPSQFRTGPYAKLNPAYASNIEQFILDKKPSVWVHGHTHTRLDYQVGDTRILCNPAGYPGENHFIPTVVFEV